MNRRTFLRSAGVAATVGLAGCVDGVREHFGLQGIVPMEIHSEAERTHNLHIQAYDLDAERASYEQSITVTPGETAGPPNLDKSNQSLRVARIDDEEEAEVREASITPETELVVIRVYDDELVIEVDHGDDGANETVDGDDANQTTGTDGNETEGDDNETADDDGTESATDDNGDETATDDSDDE